MARATPVTSQAQLSILAVLIYLLELTCTLLSFYLLFPLPGIFFPKSYLPTLLICFGLNCIP